MSGILVIGEVADGKLQPAVGELLAAGRSLSDSTSEEVAVAIPVGANDEALAAEGISLGADKVYMIEDPLLAEPGLDALVAAFEAACREVEPSTVLVGRTPTGRDVGPRLAFRLGVGMAQDCLRIEIDEQTKRIAVTRPVYGGNAMARVIFKGTNPQVVVLRGKVYEPLEADPGRQGETVTIQANIDPGAIKARLVETVKREAEGVRLEDAPIVIGGGRGLGGPEPFEMLEDLAKVLGGAVGASRAVCDAGWLDHSYQIGLTGKTITPGLYITVGISGASQHMAGCSGAKSLVAINRDGDANIFKEATFGVVGDWKNVLPSFVETVRELVES